MSDVLINVKTTTDLKGLEATKSGLASLEAGMNHASDQWEKLGRRLQHKFSMADLGKEVMMGLGIGSGFALAEKAASLLTDHFREAAEHAKTIADETERQLQAVKDLITLRQTTGQIEVTGAKTVAEARKDYEDSKKPKITTKASFMGVDNIDTIPIVLARTAADEKATAEKLSIWSNLAKAQEELIKKNKEKTESDRAAYSEEAKLALEIKKVNDLVGAGGMGRAEADRRIAILQSQEAVKQGLAEAAAQDKINAEDEKLAESSAKFAEERHKAAEAIRAEADETEKYRQAVDAIKKLEGGNGGLSAAEVAAAIAHLDAERKMVEERKKDTALATQLSEIESQRALIENNQLLTKQEIDAKILPLLAQENALTADRIKLLAAEAAISNDPKLVAQLNETINRLQNQLAGLQGKAQGIATAPTLSQQGDIGVRDLGDPTKHYQSAGDGLAGSLKSQVAELGTFGDQVNRTFTNVGNSIRTSLGGALADIVLKSGSFKSKVVGFGNAIAVSFIQNGAQMVADWIYQHTVMAAIRRFFHTEDVAEHAATTGTKVGITAGGQAAETGVTATGSLARRAIKLGETIFHGIQVAIRTAAHFAGEIAQTAITVAQVPLRIVAMLAESGVKLVSAALGALAAMSSIPWVGPILAIAAMGAILAAGSSLLKREQGGPVTAGQAYLVGEKRPEVFVPNTSGFIIPSVAQAMTRPGYAPSSGGAAGADGGMAGGGRSINIGLVNSRAEREHLERDPHRDTIIMDCVKRNRRQLGIRI